MDFQTFIKGFFTLQAFTMLGFGAVVSGAILRLFYDKLDEGKRKREERRRHAREMIRLCSEAEHGKFQHLPDTNHVAYVVKEISLEDEQIGKLADQFFKAWVTSAKKSGPYYVLLENDAREKCDKLVDQIKKWK